MPEQSASTRWNGAPNHVAAATCSAAANRFGPWLPRRVLLGSQLGRSPVGSRCLPRRGGARRFARARACPSGKSARLRPQFCGVRRARHRMCPGDGQPIRRQCRDASSLELITMLGNRCAQSRAIDAQRPRRHKRGGLTTNAAPGAAPIPARLVIKLWRIGNV